MNEDTITGKLKSAVGKIKQSAGETTGDQSLANSGTADQVRGATQESWGQTKEAASEVGTAVKHDSESHQTADKVRDSISRGAENAKSFIGDAMDQLKGKVHEHELDRDGREVHQVH